MTPFEVLGLLAGLVVLAVILGTFWQKWEEFKLMRDGIPQVLEDVRRDLVAAQDKIKALLRA